MLVTFGQRDLLVKADHCFIVGHVEVRTGVLFFDLLVCCGAGVGIRKGGLRGGLVSFGLHVGRRGVGSGLAGFGGACLVTL
jgi:hypothetical protein